MNKKDKQEPMTPQAMQMSTAKLFEYMQQQNFESIEEMNEFFAKNIVGKRIDEILPVGNGPKSAEEQSDDLMYEAYNSNLAEALELVKKALELNPENVRAITFLADNEPKKRLALKLYKQAVDAGAKQLGASFFKENTGYFWGLAQTRPFMSAKFGYANCLLAMKKTDEAIAEYTELLTLNPNDNQGVRYNFAGVLLFSKRFSAFFELYKKYKDEQTTFWNFNYALYLFATEGATMKAKMALVKANKQNKHVVQFMIGRKKIVLYDDNYYSPGDESEASAYLIDTLEAWVACPGVLEWVKDFVEKGMKPK
jgi:tetratricopeptide (TPR) repeat protein